MFAKNHRLPILIFRSMAYQQDRHVALPFFRVDRAIVLRPRVHRVMRSERRFFGIRRGRHGFDPVHEGHGGLLVSC